MDTPPVLPASPASPPAPRPKRRGRRKLLIAGFALLLLLGLGSYWSLHDSDPAVTVQTEKVARRTITETVVASGKIYPVLQVHISPEVSGEITELAVKEGQAVHKGDLLLKIKPDFYLAALNQAKAAYQSSLATKATAEANLEKAEADFKRNAELFTRALVSESDYDAFKVARNVAKAQLESAGHQVEVARAAVDSAQDSLSKTTIVAPIDGTVTTLNSQAGERVLGTVQNAGTDIMIISDLTAIEARVDIGEMDVVLLRPGEKAVLEVDSFKDKKFSGLVTDVANASESMNAKPGLAAASASAGQSATQFQVRIRFTEIAEFRPGMSVTAKIETRCRTNVIAAPIASVTTRLVSKTNAPTNSLPATNSNPAAASATEKPKENENKPVEVIFMVKDGKAKVVPVTIGISDDNYWEIVGGLNEGDEIVVGNYRAVSRDLEDGKKVKKSGGVDKSS